MEGKGGRIRKVWLTALGTILLPLLVEAQQPDTREPPFMTAALTAGAMGYTSGHASRPVLGAYGHAAFRRLILGAQIGGEPVWADTDLFYGMATLGYPAGAIRKSLIYPFIGVGGGILHDGVGPRNRGGIYGAGVGIDRLVSERPGPLLGIRAGYLIARGDAGERLLYVSIAAGVGGRRAAPEKPPVIIAASAGGAR